MFDTPMFCMFLYFQHDEQRSERWGEEESDQQVTFGVRIMRSTSMLDGVYTMFWKGTYWSSLSHCEESIMKSEST